MGSKGISIWYDEEDLKELNEFVIWKTKKAAAKSDSSMSFSGGGFDVDHNLDETTKLIAAARRELQQAKELRLEQNEKHAHVAQQRESISTLDDRAAQAQQKVWAEEAKTQGESYAAERNQNRSGRAYVTEEEKSIRDGVVSWIKRQKMRGHFGGQKSLAKN